VPGRPRGAKRGQSWGTAGDESRELLPWTAGPGAQKNLVHSALPHEVFMYSLPESEVGGSAAGLDGADARGGSWSLQQLYLLCVFLLTRHGRKTLQHMHTELQHMYTELRGVREEALKVLL